MYWNETSVVLTGSFGHRRESFAGPVPPWIKLLGVALMPSFRGHPFLETLSVSPVCADRIEKTLGKCIESGSDSILGQSVLPLRADPPKIFINRDGLEAPLRPEGKGQCFSP